MNKIPIRSVMFTYNGDDQAFAAFLRTVVHDYINSPKTPVRDSDHCENNCSFPPDSVVVFGVEKEVLP